MNAVGWNADKPHRCPACHTITDPEHRARRAVVTCCTCGTDFTRHPRLAWVLPWAGVVCPEDHE